MAANQELAMSRELGLAVLRADYNQPRIPVMEHFGALSREALIHLTGLDPLDSTVSLNRVFRRAAEVLEVDLQWGGGLPSDDRPVHDWSKGPVVRKDEKGQDCVQWGIFHTVHAEDGRHYHHIPRPQTIDAALDFDPAPWFAQSVDQLTERFAGEYERMLASCDPQCQPLPNHYTTAFHFPLAIFGFELLCEAGMHEARFARLMDRFAAISRRITEAWSQVDGLAGFICHDDLTMTSGPIFRPDWYRRHIFRHYPAIFEPFNRKGIPVVFTSDGDCSMFVDDIFAAGADGLNFEHWVPLEPLVGNYPDKILIGNLSSDILAHGTVEQVIEHTTQAMRTGSRARRFVVNVGGQLTHDIPVKSLMAYLDTRKRLARELRQPEGVGR
jgi:hypothetical protein